MCETVIVTVCSTEVAARDSVVAGLLCDLPDVAAVGYDVDSSGSLSGWVVDPGTAPLRHTQPLAQECASCAVGIDLLRVVGSWRAEGRVPPRVLVLVLPPTVEPGLVHGPAPRGTRFGPVVTALEAAGLEEDLLGGDLLAERGLALSPQDRRGLGEVVAHLLDAAHVVATAEDLPARARLLIDHLAGPVVDLRWRDLDAHALELDRPVRQRPHGRTALRSAAPTGARDRDGVWTLDLDSWRPLHPDRLREGAEALAQGRIRGRGRFWLPSRPSSLIGWDGAGGQLAIGVIGSHDDAPARSRLVITGVDGDPDLHRLAFERAQMTGAELSRGLDRWIGRDDGFAPWLGGTDLLTLHHPSDDGS